MFRNILLDIPKRSLGPPKAPDWPLLCPVEHACGVAFSLPLVAVSAHPRSKDGGCRRRSKSFLSVDFAWGSIYFRLPRIIIPSLTLY